MGKKKLDFKLDFNEIRIKIRDPVQVRILRIFGNILDPLNLYYLLIEAIRNTRFFLEDKYQEEREKLQHFFDLFVPAEFDLITERVLIRIKNLIDKIFQKYNKIEMDIEKIYEFLKKLYPIRSAISEHRQLLDILKDF
ncbi:MAG: hypothetical protein ACTSVY_15200 [Candidatus Helarchaeota archaeon]